MDVLAFYPRSVFNFPSCLSLVKQLKPGKPICALKDGCLAFASPKDVLQLSILSTNADKSRRGRPSRSGSAPRKANKKAESKKFQSSDVEVPKSSNQEEIIALFKRIQSSISKGKTTGAQKKDADSSKEKYNSQSVLDIICQSRNEMKATKREGDEELTGKNSVSKDRMMLYDAQHPAAKFQPTRPPSNFVKKSPVPSPSISRGKATEENSKTSAATANSNELKLPRIEEMKLPELKELAKSRGIKGYSKLKKSELLELLQS